MADKASVQKCREDLNKVRKEIAKIVIGQESVIDGLLRALVANGHVLIEGVPGIAKTLVIRALSASTGCGFKRIQFTADLLPTDIIGVTSYEEQKGFFVIKKGKPAIRFDLSSGKVFIDNNFLIRYFGLRLNFL